MIQHNEQEDCENTDIVKEQEQLQVKIRLLFPLMPCPLTSISQNVKAKGRGKNSTWKAVSSSQLITVIIWYLKEEKTFQKGTIINATKKELESCSLNHWFCASSLFYININFHCELLHLNLVRNTF